MSEIYGGLAIGFFFLAIIASSAIFFAFGVSFLAVSLILN